MIEWVILGVFAAAVIGVSRRRHNRRITREGLVNTSTSLGSFSRTTPGLPTFPLSNSSNPEFYDDEADYPDEFDEPFTVSWIDDDDAEYEQFVSEHWALAGLPLNGLSLERLSGSSAISLQGHSLVQSNGRLYLNAWEGGVRKTYAADGRCRWARDGEMFKPEAFAAAFKQKDPSLLSHDHFAHFYAYPLPPRGTVSGLVYEIQYADRYGVITERVFKLQRVFDNYQDLEIEGYCYLRRELRTFLVSRILKVSDHRNGAPILHPRDYFGSFINGRLLREPEHESVFRRAKPGLQLLSWTASAGGEISEEVLNLIFDFVDQRATMSSAKSARSWNKDKVRYWINHHRTTEAECRSIISKIVSQSERELILKYLEELMLLPSHLIQNRAKRMIKSLAQ